jgi:hypothetical protein
MSSLKIISIFKPVMDYPRDVLDPITGSSKGVYALDQLYPNHVVLDMIIRNGHSTNTLTFRLNNSTVDLGIPAGSGIAYSNIIIWKIEITSDGVPYEIQLFGLKREIIMGR